MFFIAGLTMLQNDYFDRKHDIKKGRDFVSKNENLVLLVVLIGWLGCMISSILFFESRALLLSIVIAIGIFYSFFKKIQLLPLITVAFVSASPIVVSSFPNITRTQVILFCAVALSILGREILKDIEDKDIDVGYKATLPTSGWISEKQAYFIAGTSIVVGVTLSSFLIKSLTGFSYSFYMAGLAFMTTSVFFVFYFNESTRAKKFFDLGMVSILVAFSI
jgi:4-hydroxybenzoate polyprenyltransferase